ncbi:MAG: hypothetical protein F6K47_31070 [Symploca sp. SIO2E6]|nr:hypothetical protein [Symploca sp. SIO2E6]
MIFTNQLQKQEQLIEQLQAQIAEAAAKKQRLQELEFIATGALDALKDTVAQFKDGEPDALASLKAAVEELFDEKEVLNEDEELTGQSTELACLLEDAPLNGQSCWLAEPWDFDWELTNPDGSSWEIATPLCCPLSDAPVTKTAEAKKLYMDLVQLSERVSYQRKYDGEIQVTYAGFPDWNSCRKTIPQLKVLNLEFEKRKEEKKKPTRTGCKWELKIWGMSMEQITKLNAQLTDVPQKYIEITKMGKYCGSIYPVKAEGKAGYTIEIPGVGAQWFSHSDCKEVSPVELKASIDPVAAETAEFLAQSNQRVQEILDGKRPMPGINERGTSQLSWNQKPSEKLRQQTLDKTAAIAFFKQNNVPPEQWQARYEEMQAAAS